MTPMKNYLWLLAVLVLCAAGAFVLNRKSTAPVHNGTRFLVKLLPADGKPINSSARLEAIRVWQKRLPESRIEALPDSPDRVSIETAAPQAARLIKARGQLEFKHESVKLVVDSQMLVHAVAAKGYGEMWEVQFELNDEGARAFADLTKRLVGKKLGIYVDGKLLSEPTVQTPITGGHGVITGLRGEGATSAQAESEQLARLLNNGTLPADVELKID